MDVISADVNRIFDWFGFEAMDSARINLQSEGFTTFTSIANISEQRIASIKLRYGRNGLNDIGDHCMLDVIGAIYWVQDRHRIGETPTLDNIRDANEFRRICERSRLRAWFRNRTNVAAVSQRRWFNPGNFIDSETWSEYEVSFVRYLGVMHGVMGIPLLYVVREVEMPNQPIDEDNCDFYQETIARAPLHGAVYQADAETVHHMIRNFLRIRSDAFHCLDALTLLHDGRRDMIELRKHHYGVGNTFDYPPHGEGCGCRNML